MAEIVFFEIGVFQFRPPYAIEVATSLTTRLLKLNPVELLFGTRHDNFEVVLRERLFDAGFYVSCLSGGTYYPYSHICYNKVPLTHFLPDITHVISVGNSVQKWSVPHLWLNPANNEERWFNI